MRATLLILGSLVFTSLARGQESRSVLTQEHRAAFAWIDSFGIPDLSARQYVHVLAGNGTRYADDPPNSDFVRAFLVARAPEEFEAWSLDTRTAKYAAVVESRDVLPWRFEPADLRTDAVRLAQQLRSRKNLHDYLDASHTLSIRAQAVVLARICALRAFETEAAELCREAVLISDYDVMGVQVLDAAGKPVPPREAVSLSHVLETDFDQALRWQLAMAFGDSRLTRPQILARYEWYLATFPKGRWRDSAKSMVDILRSMIAEDEARKSRPAPESRSVDQLVADLIFDLRDATGSAYEWAYEPWLADLLSPPPSERPKGASPQDRLAALGLVAVPQLKAALGDQRPTRSCSYFERFGGSFTVDTVGYWARVILERIDNAARQPSPR